MACQWLISGLLVAFWWFVSGYSDQPIRGLLVVGGGLDNHFPTTNIRGQEWGVGSVVVGSAFGAPQISAPNCPESLQNKGFGENRGAPEAQIQRPRIQRPILGPLTIGSNSQENVPKKGLHEWTPNFRRCG